VHRDFITYFMAILEAFGKYVVFATQHLAFVQQSVPFI
jgi:hypothetical protein